MSGWIVKATFLWGVWEVDCVGWREVCKVIAPFYCSSSSSFQQPSVMCLEMFSFFFLRQ